MPRSSNSGIDGIVSMTVVAVVVVLLTAYVFAKSLSSLMIRLGIPQGIAGDIGSMVFAGLLLALACASLITVVKLSTE